jgi:hypothetical protein
MSERGSSALKTAFEALTKIIQTSQNIHVL